MGRREGKERVELGCILTELTKRFSPQNGEKTVKGEGESDLFIDQDARVQVHMGFCPVCWPFFVPRSSFKFFFFFFLCL